MLPPHPSPSSTPVSHSFNFLVLSTVNSCRYPFTHSGYMLPYHKGSLSGYFIFNSASRNVIHILCEAFKFLMKVVSDLYSIKIFLYTSFNSLSAFSNLRIHYSSRIVSAWKLWYNLIPKVRGAFFSFDFSFWRYFKFIKVSTSTF